MSDLRTTARSIFMQTLAAIEVGDLVRQQLTLRDETLRIGETTLSLEPFRRIIVIALGKASLPMARAAEAALGTRISAGLVVTNALAGQPLQRLPVYFGAHPLPNRGSLSSAQAALQLLSENDAPDTLVLFLVSGGGSAMFETPLDPRITLDDLQSINRILVGCGAVIGEMNVVRRFLSGVKGGRLAAAARQARQVSLYISDVNDDDLATVSSGPTLASPYTRADFDQIVARYDLLKQFPAHIAELIRNQSLPDLPKFDAPARERQSHQLLLDNRITLKTAQTIAERDFACHVEIAADLVEAEVEALARTHLTRLQSLRQKHPGKLVALLSGGEAICPVRGKGQGGRNQEFVLRAALACDEQAMGGFAVLSAGTDGIDGNSPATGAVADETTLTRATAQQLDGGRHLTESNAYPFFHALGDTLITGPTGNNVRDLRILLAPG